MNTPFSMKLSEQSVVTVLFIIGFLTVNIPLVGITSEYQPLVLFFLGIGLTFKYHKAKASSMVLLIAISFLALLEIYQFKVGWEKDFIRIVMGPTWFLLAIVFFKNVPLLAIKVIISIHGIFLLIGIFFPSLAAAIVHLLGLRGGVYYGGWNAYFSSEPSYFSLNLSGLIAISFLLKNKGEKELDRFWLVLCVLLLLSSLSLTGIVCALALSLVLFFGLSKRSKIYISCLTVLLITFFGGAFILQNSERMLPIITTIASSDSLLYSLNLVEPSGMWRLLMNSIGVGMLFTHPFGIGGFYISSVFMDLSKAYPMLTDLIASNPTYLTIPNFTAQAILSIYAVYGGIPMVLVISYYLFAAVINILMSRVSINKYFIIFYLILGFIWQSAATNPFWWILLAGCLSYKIRRYKFK